jgi:hypothetical protein
VLSSVLSSLASIPFISSLSGRQQRIVVSIGASLVIVLVGCACVALNPSALYFLRREPYAWASAMSLQRVSMVSADEGWAVGSITGRPNTLLMHYFQRKWTILAKPAGLDDRAEFAAVSMVSASSCRT